MTVKIKNDDLFNAYLNAEDKANNTFTDSLFSDIRLRGRQELVEDMGKVRDAFLNHEKVEWEEPEYYVRLKCLGEEFGYLEFSNNCFYVGDGVYGHFTKSWLRANWKPYDLYDKAGLLIFDEVEL